MTKLPIYISTSNDYLKVLRISLRLFQMFWKSFDEYQVTIFGYDTPGYQLPDNVRFVSMGAQVGGPAMWSTDLRGLFEKVEDNFIYIVDDMFMRREVNESIIAAMQEMTKNLGIARASLINDSGPFTDAIPFDVKNGIEFVQMSQAANYRNSTQPSIWRKEYFLRFLKPNLTPWQFEIKGSEDAKNDGEIIIGTKGAYAMDVFEGVRIPPRGRGPQNPYIEMLPSGCIETLKREGII